MKKSTSLTIIGWFALIVSFYLKGVGQLIMNSLSLYFFVTSMLMRRKGD